MRIAHCESRSITGAHRQNQGHGDALEIAFQTRPFLFQLAVKKPEVLYSKVVEVEERIIPEWSEMLEEGKMTASNGDRLVKTSSGIVVRILQELGAST